MVQDDYCANVILSIMHTRVCICVYVCLQHLKYLNIKIHKS